MQPFFRQKLLGRGWGGGRLPLGREKQQGKWMNPVLLSGWGAENPRGFSRRQYWKGMPRPNFVDPEKPEWRV